MKLGKLNWSNTAYSDVLSILTVISTHSNQWDGKCHNLWIISMRFNTALDSCSIYDQFIAVHRRSSKVRACLAMGCIDSSSVSIKIRITKFPVFYRTKFNIFTNFCNFLSLLICISALLETLVTIVWWYNDTYGTKYIRPVKHESLPSVTCCLINSYFFLSFLTLANFRFSCLAYD